MEPSSRTGRRGPNRLRQVASRGKRRNHRRPQASNRRPNSRRTQNNREVVQVEIVPDEPSIETEVKPQSQNSEVEHRGLVCNACSDDLFEIKRTNRKLVTTPCGHLFCADCAHRLKESSNQCSVCTKKLKTKNTFTPIFV